MTTSTTSSVYIHVIEDVIDKVRDEFVNSGGPGEAVLKELQGLWELKMMQAGVILGPIDRTSVPRPTATTTPGGTAAPVHDLNVPYEGPEEFETPTADLLFPPTPLQTPMQTPLPGTAQTPLPGTVDNSPYNIPTGLSDYSNGQDTPGPTDGKTARSSPYMPPPSPWMQQRPPLDVNVAYVEGREEADRGARNQPLTQDFFQPPSGKRKRDDFPYQNGGYIPQRDGAGDSTFEHFKEEDQKKNDATGQYDMISSAKRDMALPVTSSYVKIPQLDGPIPDPYEELSTPNIYSYQGIVNEDYNIVNTPAPHDSLAGTPAPVIPNDVREDDDDEPPLNENDDDDLDDIDQGDELNTQHLVLAQFDKVTRTKSRWKCTLKDGIMHINNKDILFNKATGEFDF